MGRTRFMLVIVLLMGALGFLGLGAKSSQGAGYEITPEPRPTITPIPRPTLATEASTQAEPAGDQSGAHIVLRWERAPITTTLSTVVQWQGGGGNWFNVDGWKGDFDHQGWVRWWVAPEHYHTGPYRWVIFAARDDPNPILWVSDPFYLPDGGQTLVIRVTTPLSR